MNDHILDRRLPHVITKELYNEHTSDLLLASYKPLFTIPKRYSCYCHPCDTPFKSIEEMQKHTHSTAHNRNKEIYLQVKS